MLMLWIASSHPNLSFSISWRVEYKVTYGNLTGSGLSYIRVWWGRDAIRKPTTISRPSNCNDLSCYELPSNGLFSVLLLPSHTLPLLFLAFYFPLVLLSLSLSRFLSLCCQNGDSRCRRSSSKAQSWKITKKSHSFNLNVPGQS